MYFACQHIGALPCALHLRNTAEGITRTLDWLGTELLVVEEKFRELALDASRRRKQKTNLLLLNSSAVSESEFSYDSLCDSTRSGIPLVDIDVDQPAKIILSSGTTGEPKGVVHSQRTLYESALAGVEVFGKISTADSVLVIMSPSFAAWNHVILTYLYRGAKLVFNNVFDPGLFLGTLESSKITNTALVPTAWRRVLQHMDGQHDLSALKLAFFSGEPGTPEFIKLMQEKLPQCQVRTAYLTSEGGVASACIATPEVLSVAIGSVGVPVSTAEVRLVSETGSIDEELAQGEVGEILVKGSSLALAYWNNPELSKKKFINGWWRSGDLGRIDTHGYLAIVGRTDNMIISGGLKVHAEEVEAALLQHPALDMVAVVGQADPEWGQRIEAHVVSNSKTTEDEILAYCREHNLLASFKLPKRIHFCDSLPTGSTGKIYRRGLLQD